MIKHKNTSLIYSKTTIVFGYGLFVLTVLSFLVSTAIPLSFSLSYSTARHFNIVAIIIAFAIATILPALASYIIGDKVTHAKNKPLHHYNGVLFGVVAYWVAQLFTWIGFSSVFGVSELPFPAPLAVTNIVPVILTIITMCVVAVAYAKKQNKRASVLQYRPYQVVLIAAVIGACIAPYVSGSFDINFLGASIATLAIPIVAILIAYRVLIGYQTTRASVVSEAFIAMSMGWIATWLANSFISITQLPYQTIAIASYVIGLFVFAAYLYLRTRRGR